jgi:ABC-2 type transport system ATP-binding protein
MILEIRNLEKKFNNNQVLKNINLNIEEGTVLAVLGKNGSGKTTLIKLLTNILLPCNGDILYKGENIKRLRNKYIEKIGAVLEGNRNVYWYLTGEENIYYFGGLLGLSKNEIKVRGEELLKTFDLYEDRRKKVVHYSRGMQQKLAIIIALLNNPTILFLDEPAIGLDVVSKKIMIDKIKYLSRNLGITIILTTHQLDVVELVADKIVLLENGGIKNSENLKRFMEKYNSELLYKILLDKRIAKEEIESIFNELNNYEINNNKCSFEVKVSDKRLLNDFMKYINKKNINLLSLSSSKLTLEDILSHFWREKDEVN